MLDERLADLSPLLSELYFRLRPHTDWAQVEYLMRGDVRRFLSLRVAGTINPRFVFSSGQKRVLGLAFLLAVHLSRPWCALDTLVLDDPVQKDGVRVEMDFIPGTGITAEQMDLAPLPSGVLLSA